MAAEALELSGAALSFGDEASGEDEASGLDDTAGGDEASGLDDTAGGDEASGEDDAAGGDAVGAGASARPSGRRGDRGRPVRDFLMEPGRVCGFT